MLQQLDYLLWVGDAAAVFTYCVKQHSYFDKKLSLYYCLRYINEIKSMIKCQPFEGALSVQSIVILAVTMWHGIKSLKMVSGSHKGNLILLHISRLASDLNIF